MKKIILITAAAIVSITSIGYAAGSHLHIGKSKCDYGTRCLSCNGTGWNGNNKCITCRGTGSTSAY